MCTVSFIARQRGYLLGMNRDEKLARVAGLAPAWRTVNRVRVLGPSEPGGGTWITLNENRVAFALINWYSIPARVSQRPVSRGEVVNAVSPFNTAESATAALKQLPLARVNPFRLIGVFPARRDIFEWRWDLKRLVCKKHRWQTQQWISSGFDEPTAQRERTRTFHRALRQRSAGGLDWLRRLHRSHTPQAGPFSTCMHRADAATVSYTEITVTAGTVEMRYHAGAPCQNPQGRSQSLKPSPFRPR